MDKNRVLLKRKKIPFIFRGLIYLKIDYKINNLSTKLKIFEEKECSFLFTFLLVFVEKSGLEIEEKEAFSYLLGRY